MSRWYGYPHAGRLADAIYFIGWGKRPSQAGGKLPALPIRQLSAFQKAIPQAVV